MQFFSNNFLRIEGFSLLFKTNRLFFISLNISFSVYDKSSSSFKYSTNLLKTPTFLSRDEDFGLKLGGRIACNELTKGETYLLDK